MQQIATKTPSKLQLHAAQLLADDELSDEEIARAVGVNRATLWRWKQRPEFEAAIQAYRAELQAAMFRLPIARRRYRVKVVDTLHTKLLTVVEERAAQYANAEEDEAAMRAARRFFGDEATPAGGGTGLVLKQYKQVGKMMVTEYAVDTGLVREITNLHARAAKELGQEDDGPPAAKVDVRLYIGIDVDAV